MGHTHAHTTAALKITVHSMLARAAIRSTSRLTDVAIGVTVACGSIRYASQSSCGDTTSAERTTVTAVTTITTVPTAADTAAANNATTITTVEPPRSSTIRLVRHLPPDRPTTLSPSLLTSIPLYRPMDCLLLPRTRWLYLPACTVQVGAAGRVGGRCQALVFCVHALPCTPCGSVDSTSSRSRIVPAAQRGPRRERRDTGRGDR